MKSAGLLIILAQMLVGGDVALMTIFLVGAGPVLHAGPSQLQWILSATMLTCGGFLILGGRLVDVFGVRRIFLLGATLVALGVLPGLLGAGLPVIVAGRVGVGLGVACLNPATVGFIAATYPAGLPRDKAFGLFSLGQSYGFFGGMILGGLLASLAGEQALFVADFFLATVCLLWGGKILVPSIARGGLRGLDLPGAVTVTAGLGLLVFAISTAGAPGARPVIPLLGAVVLLALFIVLERRAKTPLLDFRVFRLDNIAVSLVLLLTFNALSIAVLVSALLYAQRIGHLPPAGTLLLFLPSLAVSTIMARLVPLAVGRFLSRPVVVSGFAAYLLPALLPAAVTALALGRPGLGFAFALLVVCGSATGAICGIVTIFGAATGYAPEDQRGVISAILLAVSQIGAAIGVAVSGACLAAHAPGQGENFPLTFTVISSVALAGGLLALTRLRNQAVAVGHH